jgi:hypothetical protein
MKATILIAGCFLIGGGVAALADSGPIQDPTGCATGTAVAQCSSVPTRDYTPGNSLSREPRIYSKPPRFMQTSPLPSENLRRSPTPPGSTGLDKGSTGLNRGSGTSSGNH